MPTLTLAQAELWATRVLVGVGTAHDAAQSTARALVAAEADGLKGHGLQRLPTYTGMVRGGKIKGHALPVVSNPRPGALAIDAAYGFAYPAIDLACAELPKLARANGIAIAGISRSNHAGALGHHVERLAEHGLVALFFANTPEAIAPWGGTKPVFGTNPIAFAAPVPGRAPLVIDLAMSKVARGNIVAAKQKGEAIPAGWALDAAGRPTTDPDAALAGTMIAMGDAKGTALALMVEILAAALVGGALSQDASSFLDEKGPPPATGQCIIAIDPSTFGAGTLQRGMTALVASIEGQSGARLPGQRRLDTRARAARDGLVVAQTMIDALQPKP